MKSALIHTLFLALLPVSLYYVKELEGSLRLVREGSGIARDVSIKVFGRGGEEWRIEGEELISLGKEVTLKNVMLRSSSGSTIKAGSVVLLRDRGVGTLRGEVEVRGEAFFVRTSSATVDFGKNLLYGTGGVKVWRESNYAEGKGFKAYLRPLKVIINSVRTRHEI
ncbi:MAG TPA: hypothetical protein EYP11_01255 [Aquificaceae bacterium]|nr:hypothetical protein [Aquificaceae bacterium]